MSNRPRVCVVGSLNIDVLTHVATHPTPGETVRGQGLIRLPGGKGANQALASARSGAKTRLIGRIGDDDAGDAYRRGLSAREVDCSGVCIVPDTPTGTALIAVDERGENTIIVVPGANEAMTEKAIEAEEHTIRSADVLVLQLEIPMPSVLRVAEIAAECGIRLIVNPSPWVALPAELLAAADPLIVNEHEANQLDETAAGSVCVTLGADGARWGKAAVTAPRIDVVDTTGAGDAFAGALAAALAAGADRTEALHTAAHAGATACTWPGAQGWTL
ncbi:MAG TPA: ribokinase [Pseudonocardiaceae bacterium]|jgi:ribokinase|nr:ribokinase [Pseudonocardiaceae bacterium]